ncbi:hypothetical protein DQG23_40195 [Paenibacillus contaminans]|uniref:Uncharacterized protein n=1 Tax=Paenibacillus contaminans TaxID=450362 RepID=A0A329LME3_9BACL|nr:hypothetical protein DQG23_40195 [Paenibacillus contaminans]
MGWKSEAAAFEIVLFPASTFQITRFQRAVGIPYPVPPKRANVEPSSALNRKPFLGHSNQMRSGSDRNKASYIAQFHYRIKEGK